MTYYSLSTLYRQEDLGVDHIFFKPELIMTSSVGISEQYSSKPQMSSCLFVAGSAVLPREKSCTHWDENFTISDHRPVEAKLIFGQRN